MAKKRKTIAISFAASLVLVLAMVYIYAGTGIIVKSNGLTCSSAEFVAIKNGMSKNEVSNLLGTTKDQRVKKSPIEDMFSQGENAQYIAEGWVYSFGDFSNIKNNPFAEIYFDSSGKVIGKNCGNG